MISSVQEINLNSNVPYFDAFENDAVTGRPGNGYFLWEQSRMLPFSDTTPNTVIKNQLNGPITSVTDNLNYGDEGYVPTGQIAQTSGFIYDGATLGTDSLAFGGMKYT